MASSGAGVARIRRWAIFAVPEAGVGGRRQGPFDVIKPIQAFRDQCISSAGEFRIAAGVGEMGGARLPSEDFGASPGAALGGSRALWVGATGDELVPIVDGGELGIVDPEVEDLVAIASGGAGRSCSPIVAIGAGPGGDAQVGQVGTRVRKVEAVDRSTWGGGVVDIDVQALEEKVLCIIDGHTDKVPIGGLDGDVGAVGAGSLEVTVVATDDGDGAWQFDGAVVGAGGVDDNGGSIGSCGFG